MLLTFWTPLKNDILSRFYMVLPYFCDIFSHLAAPLQARLIPSHVEAWPCWSSGGPLWWTAAAASAPPWRPTTSAGRRSESWRLGGRGRGWGRLSGPGGAWDILIFLGGITFLSATQNVRSLDLLSMCHGFDEFSGSWHHLASWTEENCSLGSCDVLAQVHYWWKRILLCLRKCVPLPLDRSSLD